MTEQFAIDVARNAFLIALQIGGPLLASSLVVGMLVSVFQAVTQINEQTLSFVPKILVVAGALALLGPWMATTLVSYMVFTFNELPVLAHH
jgi:flagellar biosynthetic protein FliQ